VEAKFFYKIPDDGLRRAKDPDLWSPLLFTKRNYREKQMGLPEINVVRDGLHAGQHVHAPQPQPAHQVILIAYHELHPVAFLENVGGRHEFDRVFNRLARRDRHGVLPRMDGAVRPGFYRIQSSEFRGEVAATDPAANKIRNDLFPLEISGSSASLESGEF
jgi:hypothetical protein